MNTHTTTSGTHLEYFGGIVGGSVTEGAGAIATIVLAIIGLAGVFANITASVAAIVIGAIFLMEGMGASAAVRRQNAHEAPHTPGLANGVTAGFFGGLAGIVLGILALFETAPGSRPEVLLAVAVLVYGAALLVGGGGLSRLTSLSDEGTPAGTMGSGSMFVGLATVVLGILAIIGLVPMTLVLVGLLSLGAGALFSGSNRAGEAA